MRARNQLLSAAATLLIVGTVACAHTDYFTGTTILRSEENQKIIETVEQYRRRLLEHNIDGLLVLASPTYFEDSGTPRSDDDYGYEGSEAGADQQAEVGQVAALRDRVPQHPRDAETAPRSKCSSTARSSSRPRLGDRYRRVNDYHRFILEHENEQWKFVGGM